MGRLSGARRAGLQGLPARDLLAGLLTDRLGDIVVHFRPGQIDPALAPRQGLEVGRPLGIPVQEAPEREQADLRRQGLGLAPVIEVAVNVDLQGPHLLGIGKEGVRERRCQEQAAVRKPVGVGYSCGSVPITKKTHPM